MLVTILIIGWFSAGTGLPSISSTCEIECYQNSANKCQAAGCIWRQSKLPQCVTITDHIRCGDFADGMLSCLQRGCVWFPTDDPACYYPTASTQFHDKAQCMVACGTNDEDNCKVISCTWNATSAPHCYKTSDRIRCAPNGIGKEACETTNGCIWDKTNATFEPWCYYEKVPGTFINCHPDKDPTTEACIARGCLWFDSPPVVHGPQCVFSVRAGYKMIGDPSNTYGHLARLPTPYIFGPGQPNLDFKIQVVFPNIGAFVVGNTEKHELLRKPTTDPIPPPDFSWTIDDNPFGVKIFRKSTGFPIFDTTGIPGLTFEKNYIQISTRISTRNIYGFGEIAKTSFRHEITWRNFTLWNHDPYGPDSRKNPDLNLYGYHLFYMGVEPDGKAHGILLYQTYPVNIAIQPDPDIITFRFTTDGDPDGNYAAVYFMVGDNPGEVIEKYTAIVNKPVLPPYWGLGYQLSRYGYNTLENMQSVYNRNVKAAFPIDVQYADIDYMDKYRDFTYDKIRFAGLPDFVKALHDTHVRFVPIIDPGIAAGDDSYNAYSDGVAADVFIKNSTGQYIEGVVWPGTLVFPDFKHRNIRGYWTKLLRDFYDEVPYDGVWFDMNEPTSLIDGSTVGCPINLLNNPPYNPLNYGMDLLNMTLCNDAQTNGASMLRAHNQYGFNEVVEGYAALNNIFSGKRPYILTRSTFMGSGMYAAHWSGDLYSTHDAMRYSIINMLDFGLFGMPWVGSDICGFHSNATEELCVKWHQLGAFYPFARNHNDIGYRAQDPAAWSPAAQEKIREALRLRYAFMPMLYTEMVKAAKTGRPPVRALFFEYPTDETTLEIDDQFLWGTSMMVTPILNEGATSREAYFPKGRWYRLDNQVFTDAADGGTYRTVTSYLPWIRDGTIYPSQEPNGTTYETRQMPLTIRVFLNETRTARGELYWDDGVSANPYLDPASADYYHFSFYAFVSCNRPDGALVLKQLNTAKSDFEVPALKYVFLAGLSEVPTWAKIDGREMNVEPQEGATKAVLLSAPTPVSIKDKSDVTIVFR